MWCSVFLASPIIVIVLASEHEWSTEERNIIAKCAKDLGYGSPMLENLSKEERERMVCIMSCSYIEMGMISKEGTMNASNIGKTFKEKVKYVRYAIKTCENRSGDDSCSKITNKIRCVYRQLQPRPK